MAIQPEFEDAGLPPLNPGALPPEPDPAEVLKKKVYIGFGAIIALGLAMTALYIGGRLFAHPAVRPAPASVAKASPVVVPKGTPVIVKEAPVVAKAAPKPEVTAAPIPEPSGSVPKVITPQPRERYLQLAALGPNYTEKYLPVLRAKGFNAVVAPGPTDGIYRIIIGPFPDQLALEKQRDVLEAAGIQSMLRVY